MDGKGETAFDFMVFGNPLPSAYLSKSDWKVDEIRRLCHFTVHHRISIVKLVKFAPQGDINRIPDETRMYQ